MRRTIVICCGALLMLGASCQKKQASFANDEIMMTDAHHLIVNEDSKFSGELWDESHRLCFELNDGKKTKLSVTHDNGQIACEYEFGTGVSHFFDENGGELTQAEFGKKYRKLILKLQEQFEQGGFQEDELPQGRSPQQESRQ